MTSILIYIYICIYSNIHIFILGGFLKWGYPDTPKSSVFMESSTSNSQALAFSKEPFLLQGSNTSSAFQVFFAKFFENSRHVHGQNPDTPSRTQSSGFMLTSCSWYLTKSIFPWPWTMQRRQDVTPWSRFHNFKHTAAPDIPSTLNNQMQMESADNFTGNTSHAPKTRFANGDFWGSVPGPCPPNGADKAVPASGAFVLRGGINQHLKGQDLCTVENAKSSAGRVVSTFKAHS